MKWVNMNHVKCVESVFESRIWFERGGIVFTTELVNLLEWDMADFQ